MIPSPLRDADSPDRGTVAAARRHTGAGLGYPEAALAHSDHALKDAREIGQVATLMHVLAWSSFPLIHCGAYAAGNALINELLALADEKGSLFWKAWGMMHQGCASVLTGKASEAVNMITSGITAWRSTGATMLVPFFLSYLARAHAQLGKFDDAWRCIGEAMAAVEATSEKLWEADINRTAGGIVLSLPQPDAAKAEEYFPSRSPADNKRSPGNSARQ
jgi:hypothetical protein